MSVTIELFKGSKTVLRGMEEYWVMSLKDVTATEWSEKQATAMPRAMPLPLH